LLSAEVEKVGTRLGTECEVLLAEVELEGFTLIKAVGLLEPAHKKLNALRTREEQEQRE
jgi:hypothetical protein